MKSNSEELAKALEQGTDADVLLGVLAEMVTGEQLREALLLAGEQS